METGATAEKAEAEIADEARNRAVAKNFMVNLVFVECVGSKCRKASKTSRKRRERKTQTRSAQNDCTSYAILLLRDAFL